MSSGSDNHKFTKHPYFDLLLPTKETLEQCVGARVQDRKVFHEWPLSCVERVVFEGGIEKYCKTMRPPSMEIDAYAALTSPLLVPHIVVAHSEPCSTLLLDSFAGQCLTSDVVEKAGLFAFIDSLRDRLKSISANGPVFVDLSSVQKVRENMTIMMERLHRRFGVGATPEIDPVLLGLAEDCSMDAKVIDAFLDDAVYSNGDLSAGNILVRNDDIRVIDWQFPRIASLKVEAVNLCTTLGIDPRAILSDSIIAAGLLCKVRWLAECADVWLPLGSYHNEITTLLRQIATLEMNC